MNSTRFQPPAHWIGNTRSHLKPRTLVFRYLAEINVILGLWYLQWRILHTLNYDALWLAIPLLIAEVYSFCGGVMFTIGLWRPLERQVRSLDQLRPPLPTADFPTVDVFVTCYNEPVEIIERTTRAALDLDYPVDKLRVYVLDDGNMSAVQDMAQRLGQQDREKPEVQQAEQCLQTEIILLTRRYRHLKQLELELAKPGHDAGPNSPSLLNPADPAAVLELPKFRRLLEFLQPQRPGLSDRLTAEKQRLMAEICRQEKALAQLSRCQYIARPKPVDRPHHAKAGNINYALFNGQCAGEFIVTLDTDHVLQPRFLKRTLPFFFHYNLLTDHYDSNRIAFVQTPQTFGNLPACDPFGHHAHLFYGPIQQGKDGLNSAFYTGTNAVLRREALVHVGIKQFAKECARDAQRLQEFDLVGGLSTHSITEDMNTAMRLHADGWQSVYHHELMAEGLAPEDLGSMIKQRLRWAQGTIQVLCRDNPLLLPGLTIWQRLQYFQTMYSYFSGFTTLIYLLAPIVYFFTGIAPVSAIGMGFALHFFPTFVCNRLTFITATWGIPAREVWRSEQYAIALFPVFIRAVCSVFSRQPLPFQVTPKQRQAGIYLRLVLPQLAIFGLTIAGIAWSLYRFVNGKLPQPEIYLFNGVWSLYNLALLWSIIRASVWQPENLPKIVDLKPRSRTRAFSKTSGF